MSIHGFVIFCDDIRFENNGKAILIGVYSEDLVPGILPQVLPLSFWVKLNGVMDSNLKLKLNIGVNGKVQHTVDADLSIQDTKKPVNLYFAGLPINIEESGNIFIEVSGFKDGFVFKDKLNIMPVPN